MMNAADEAMQGPVSTFVRNKSMDDKNMVPMRSEAAAMDVSGTGVLDHDFE